MTMKHFARLFGIAMAIVGVWLVAGLFTASEFYRRTLALSGARKEIGFPHRPPPDGAQAHAARTKVRSGSSSRQSRRTSRACLRARSCSMVT